MTRIILASASLARRKLLESLGLKFEVMESKVDEEKIVDRDPVKMACKRAKAKAAAVAAEILNQNQRTDGSKQKTVASMTVKKKKQSSVSQVTASPSHRFLSSEILVIGADTVGYQGSWVFNKPKSRKEAEEMLARLSGKTHKYVSAHAIIKLESRNSKLETNSNDRNSNFENKKKNLVLNFKNLNLKNCFGFRYSNFEFISGYDISSVTFRKLSKSDIDFYLDRVEYLKLCGGLKIIGSPQNFVTKTEGSISNIIGLSLEKLIPVLDREETIEISFKK